MPMMRPSGFEDQSGRSFVRGRETLAGAHAHARIVGSSVAAGHHSSSSIDEAGAAWVLP